MLYRKIVLVMIVAVGVAALGTLFTLRSRYFSREIKSCFNDVQGLREGAPIRIAGVQVGMVRRIQANPQNSNCPAEVEMMLSTPYELQIPKDSIAGIERDGIVGPVLVKIDTNHAWGPPIDNYGYLKSRPAPPQPSIQDALKAMEAVVKSSAGQKLDAPARNDSTEAPLPNTQ